jgi:copper resistance protein B
MRRRAGATLAAILAAVLSAATDDAMAQTPGADPNSAAPFGPPVDDQHVWVHGILDQLEGRFGNESSLRWDGEAWTGTDSDRLWLKSEGELSGGTIDGGQHEILYDRPISTYFDLQAGLRGDFDSRPGRVWGALGIEGLAQYFFHVAATAYVSGTGHYAAKFLATYELLLTQRLILQPQFELNLYTKADPARRIGSGISDIDTGLRLRYEIGRKFAPYIGVSYEQMFAGTEDFVRAAGQRSESVRFVAGVRSWF